ncbi:MAG TPA: DEAD/DEAH box helicase [Myxococcales bacterium]|nr:DEAD/DEAH box helicase [Myxococcales bacterium]
MAEDLIPLALAISPSGAVHLDAKPSLEGCAPAALARELTSDLAHGPGFAILQLAARHPGETLPPSVAFFRDVGALFLARACAAPEGASIQAPPDELARLVSRVPPMCGGEYLRPATLEALWSDLDAALRSELRDTSLEQWFKDRHAAWNVVGRVCFHLAENKADEERPFAFLATYTTRLSSRAQPQHRPLGQAVRDFASDKSALLSLLLPVQRASEESALAKELVDNGKLFRTLAWTPAEALRFLREVPAFEAAGIVVRVPDWWKKRSRVGVEVKLGGRKPAGLGLDALVDFDVRLALDGEPLSEKEWRALAAQDHGLALVRGRWVEIDRDKLEQVLAHWKEAQRAARGGGLSLLEAMRFLAGAEGEAASPLEPDVAGWSRVSAGPWLAQALAGLRSPDALGKLLPGSELRAELRPYQEVGVRWLSFAAGLGLGTCLADDMGLGKTLQVLAFLLARKKAGQAPGPSLLVAPASLLGNWSAEIARFAPTLRMRVEHPSAHEEQAEDADLIITTYGMLLRKPALVSADWDVAILDEAQAIKNPGARQTRAVKELKARVRIALTGTPVENRPLDLWSIFDFLNPGLLGSAQAFGRFVKKLENRGYGPLRELTRPYLLRRLKTDKNVIRDLPDKTEMTAFCGLTKKQAALYQETVEELTQSLKDADGMKRRGLVLASLIRLKQICNHPSQWLRDGDYVSEASGKFGRLSALCEEIAARQEKVLVFTQFRELAEPLAAFLKQVFGAPGLVLHGETKVRERAALVESFQTGEAPFFVLSLKAGGTGLNLTAASHVVHFDRWWNPAVEEQATDRAFRIGQKRNVLVHKFVCRGTVEEKIDAMLAEKRALAGELLEGGAEAHLTEMSDADLLRTVSIDLDRALDEAA